ncbi:MAG TPA: bifunctional phosphoribosyl-AMP cyclohydrolase/phosphoribosyl-ATP diphosphatase HisIE [Pyrinomonadaceae bacterium]|nr:bifunctional phosphoribosyl-AMP cyclohydrolase/phosphoribosyl-ATP diphosphatase HisIE [Pyrinomonadaceae bacterium]
MTKIALEELKYDERGLLPVVVQDAQTREVLTLAYMNAESLRLTLETGETWFWSRSRAALWHKGETSGHTQRVVALKFDCDRDALVALVEPEGAACHTGARSCFGQDVAGAFESDKDASEWQPTKASAHASLGGTLAALYEVVEARRSERPANSYTTYLFEQGLDKILKKVGEETAETIIAAKNADAHALVSEVSDLLYHLLVLLVERGVTLAEIEQELARRGTKQSGE